MIKHAPSFEDHMQRYVYALPHCYKKDVLDAGSKEGFGAQTLSWVANSITLADISPTWLQYAKNIGGFLCKPTFVTCDFNQSFPEGMWDTIVSFEVIEHVEDPDEYLEKIKRALRPGGKLIFSVPHMMVDPLHLTLFDEAKIKTLIEKHFTLEEFMVQGEKFNGDPLYKNLICYVGVATLK